MLDLGWSELLVIAIAALIVVGPKDLPRMLRTLGQYAARAKSIAREFQRSMDEAARQADIDELREVKKDLDSVRDSQYQMQREMSQSFLDEGKANAKKKDSAEGPSAEGPSAGKAAAETPAAESGDGTARRAEPAAPAEAAPETPAAAEPGPKAAPRAGKVGGA